VSSFFKFLNVPRFPPDEVCPTSWSRSIRGLFTPEDLPIFYMTGPKASPLPADTIDPILYPLMMVNGILFLLTTT
jgi:hypothetical protein